mmetsp:Transcript_13937/g.60834  ORF Transcript_13937/g.60834 Transcript_13937/m.60834 type:complete len:483 (+) Transcript_13937:1362-2810(+)
MQRGFGAVRAAAHRVSRAEPRRREADGSVHRVLDPEPVLAVGGPDDVRAPPRGPGPAHRGAGEGVREQHPRRALEAGGGPQQARASRGVRRAGDVYAGDWRGRGAVAGSHGAGFGAGDRHVPAQEHAKRLRRCGDAVRVRGGVCAHGGRRQGAASAAAAKVGSRGRRAAGSVQPPRVRHERRHGRGFGRAGVRGAHVRQGAATRQAPARAEGAGQGESRLGRSLRTRPRRRRARPPVRRRRRDGRRVRGAHRRQRPRAEGGDDRERERPVLAGDPTQRLCARGGRGQIGRRVARRAVAAADFRVRRREPPAEDGPGVQHERVQQRVLVRGRDCARVPAGDGGAVRPGALRRLCPGAQHDDDQQVARGKRGHRAREVRRAVPRAARERLRGAVRGVVRGASQAEGRPGEGAGVRGVGPVGAAEPAGRGRGPDGEHDERDCVVAVCAGPDAARESAAADAGIRADVGRGAVGAAGERAGTGGAA